MRARNVILFRKLQRSGKRLVSLVENNRILFVASPGLSDSTCILGALPTGMACVGETYSLAASGGNPRQKHYVT
jgi:hypothetical protein